MLRARASVSNVNALSSAPLTYVMCGARGEGANALVEQVEGARYIGFELDAEEAAAVAGARSSTYVYFARAVAGTKGKRKVYLTENPACASLLPPRSEFFSRFVGSDHQMDITGSAEIDTVRIDEFLPENGIDRVDVLDLDTQGSELEILRGANEFLKSTVTCVRSEVEFAPLYEGQPLFGDVDAFLRERGFALFDLSRTRYRRRPGDRYTPTRGQLVWGNALYFRDLESLTARPRIDELAHLFVSADHFGYHDYALATLDALASVAAKGAVPVEPSVVESLRREYEADIVRGSRLVRAMHGARQRGARRPLGVLERYTGRLFELLRASGRATDFSWEHLRARVVRQSPGPGPRLTRPDVAGCRAHSSS